MVRHPTHVKDFYNEEEVRAAYYPAVEAFLRATLKADRVVIFDHIVRKRVEGAADIRGRGPRQPATRVHVDQTATSGARRVREHLPDEAEELLRIERLRLKTGTGLPADELRAEALADARAHVGAYLLAAADARGRAGVARMAAGPVPEGAVPSSATPAAVVAAPAARSSSPPRGRSR